MNWNDYFFGIMRAVAAKSKDRSAKVGAVVTAPEHEVLSVGYNGFPRGVDDTVEARHERPAKYLWTEHAERNAIYNAARVGAALSGSTMYLPCPPCSRCARGIIQAGIASVVAEMRAADFLPARSAIAWREDIELACDMLREAEVSIYVVKGKPENITRRFYGNTEGVGDALEKMEAEFGVIIMGAVYIAESKPCDNCGAEPSEAEMFGFHSRGGKLWALCTDRPACRARRAK